MEQTTGKMETIKRSPGDVQRALLSDPGRETMRTENLGRAVTAVLRFAARCGAEEARVTGTPFDSVLVWHPHTRRMTPEQLEEAADLAERAAHGAAAETEFRFGRAKYGDEDPGYSCHWHFELPDWQRPGGAADWVASRLEGGLRYAPLAVNKVPGAAPPGGGYAEWPKGPKRAAAVGVLATKTDEKTGDQYFLCRSTSGGIRSNPAGVLTHDGWVMDGFYTPRITGFLPGTGVHASVGVTVRAGRTSRLNAEPAQGHRDPGAVRHKIEAAAIEFFVEEMNERGRNGEPTLDVGFKTAKRLKAWGADEAAQAPEMLRLWEPRRTGEAGSGRMGRMDAPGAVVLEPHVLDQAAQQTLGRAAALNAGDPKFTIFHGNRNYKGYEAYDALPRIEGIRMIETHSPPGLAPIRYNLRTEWEQTLLGDLEKRRRDVAPEHRGLTVELEIRHRGSGPGTIIPVDTDVLLPVPTSRKADTFTEKLGCAAVDTHRFFGPPDELRMMVDEAYRMNLEDLDEGEAQLLGEQTADENRRFKLFKEAAHEVLPTEDAELAVVKEAAMAAAEAAPENGRPVYITVIRGKNEPRVMRTAYTRDTGCA